MSDRPDAQFNIADSLQRIAKTLETQTAYLERIVGHWDAAAQSTKQYREEYESRSDERAEQRKLTLLLIEREERFASAKSSFSISVKDVFEKKEIS